MGGWNIDMIDRNPRNTALPPARQIDPSPDSSSVRLRYWFFVIRLLHETLALNDLMPRSGGDELAPSRMARTLIPTMIDQPTSAISPRNNTDTSAAPRIPLTPENEGYSEDAPHTSKCSHCDQPGQGWSELGRVRPAWRQPWCIPALGG